MVPNFRLGRSRQGNKVSVLVVDRSGFANSMLARDDLPGDARGEEKGSKDDREGPMREGEKANTELASAEGVADFGRRHNPQSIRTSQIVQ